MCARRGRKPATRRRSAQADGRGTGALLRTGDGRGTARRVVEDHATCSGITRHLWRGCARRREVREQLTEGAVIRMDRAATLLRVILDVDLRRPPRIGG